MVSHCASVAQVLPQTIAPGLGLGEGDGEGEGEGEGLGLGEGETTIGWHCVLVGLDSKRHTFKVG